MQQESLICIYLLTPSTKEMKMLMKQFIYTWIVLFSQLFTLSILSWKKTAGYAMTNFVIHLKFCG